MGVRPREPLHAMRERCLTTLVTVVIKDVVVYMRTRYPHGHSEDPGGSMRILYPINEFRWIDQQ